VRAIALDFDGSDDVVTHGDIAAMDGAAALSICFWTFVDTLETNGGFCSKFDGVNLGFTFRMLDATGGLSGVVNLARGDIASAFSVSTWTHLAFVFDGAGGDNATRLLLYVNAVQQSLSFTGTIPATIGDAGAGLFGVMFDDYNNVRTDGKLGLLKVWSVALSAAEVAQERHSYRPARTANLLLWAPYDDGVSAKDYSGNGAHGTVTQAVQISGPPVGFGGR
jgi:hypothetical protein